MKRNGQSAISCCWEPICARWKKNINIYQPYPAFVNWGKPKITHVTGCFSSCQVMDVYSRFLVSAWAKMWVATGLIGTPKNWCLNRLEMREVKLLETQNGAFTANNTCFDPLVSHYPIPPGSGSPKIPGQTRRVGLETWLSKLFVGGWWMLIVFFGLGDHFMRFCNPIWALFKTLVDDSLGFYYPTLPNCGLSQSVMTIPINQAV